MQVPTIAPVQLSLQCSLYPTIHYTHVTKCNMDSGPKCMLGMAVNVKCKDCNICDSNPHSHSSFDY